MRFRWIGRFHIDNPLKYGGTMNKIDTWYTLRTNKEIFIILLMLAGSASAATLTLEPNINFINTSVNSLYVADTDNDGKNEIVVTTGSNVTVWEHNPDGTYSLSWSEYIQNVGWGVTAAVVGDIDNDTENEIVVAASSPHDVSSGGTIRIYEYKNGTYVSFWSTTIGEYIEHNGLSIGDADNDGKNELLVGVSWYGRKMLMFKHNTGNIYDQVWNEISGNDVISTFIGDVDNDGQNELIAGTGQWSSYDVRIYEHLTDNSYSVAWNNQWSSHRHESVFVGDSDNDGKNELLVIRNNPWGNDDDVVLFEHTGGNTYSLNWSQALVQQGGASHTNAVIGDVDNDGSNEFAVTTGDSILLCKYENGTYINIWNSTAHVRSVQIKDVDNDGKNELVAGGDRIYIYDFGILIENNTETIIPYLDTGYKFKVGSDGFNPGFEGIDFDDSDFSIGDAGFGSIFYCPLNNANYTKTNWPLYTDILLRKNFTLPPGASNLKVSVAIDNDVQVFINGYDISGGLINHEGCAVRDSFNFTAPDNLLKTGENLLAVRGKDRGVGSYLDVQVTADIPISNNSAEGGGQTTSERLVAEYHFDGNASDSSGNGNHGTIYGAIFVQGVSGQALSFDGMDDYVDNGNNLNLQTSVVTVEGWIKASDLSQHAPTIITKSRKGSDGYVMGTIDGSFFIEISHPGGWNIISKGIQADTWYHVAMTYENNKLIGYLNGEEFGNLSYTMATPVIEPLKIGHGYDTMGSWGTKGFNGFIDEVRIYNRALNASEIKAHYDALAPLPIPTTPILNGTVVSISDAATGPNSSVTRTIMVENVTNLAAATVDITYDPNIVNVLSVSAGDFGTVTTNIDNTAGKTTITAFSNTGKSGNVSFANVVLNAVGSINATSPLTLSVAAISDQNANAILYTIRNGTFTISAVSKGDVNSDGQVNVIDALLISQYTVGSRTLTQTQLAAADVNGDGQVTIVDALFIAQYTVGLRQL